MPMIGNSPLLAPLFGRLEPWPPGEPCLASYIPTIAEFEEALDEALPLIVAAEADRAKEVTPARLLLCAFWNPTQAPALIAALKQHAGDCDPPRCARLLALAQLMGTARVLGEMQYESLTAIYPQATKLYDRAEDLWEIRAVSLLKVLGGLRKPAEDVDAADRGFV